MDRCLELRKKEPVVNDRIRVAEIKDIQTTVGLLVEKLKGCNGNRVAVEQNIVAHCKNISARLHLLSVDPDYLGKHEFLRSE